MTSIRNVNKGLTARTKIIQSLETKEKSIKEISRENDLSYDCVRYHLKTLKKEVIVKKRSTNKPFVWILTGKGQQKLI